jgi:hypothetical protein
VLPENDGVVTVGSEQSSADVPELNPFLTRILEKVKNADREPLS